MCPEPLRLGTAVTLSSRGRSLGPPQLGGGREPKPPSRPTLAAAPHAPPAPRVVVPSAKGQMSEQEGQE